MTKTRGFTLVELIVTLGVAAILLGVAVPSMRDLIHNNRLAAATNLFVSSLNIARSEAIKQGRNATVCVSDTQNSCSGSTGAWLVGVGGQRSGRQPQTFPKKCFEPLNRWQIQYRSTPTPLARTVFRSTRRAP